VYGCVGTGYFEVMGPLEAGAVNEYVGVPNAMSTKGALLLNADRLELPANYYATESEFDKQEVTYTSEVVEMYFFSEITGAPVEIKVEE
jgi:hypothetical protein